EEQTNPPGLRENYIRCRSRRVLRKHYEKLLPIMADKYEYEKRKKEKLEEVKARLDFGDARKKSTRAQESTYSESRTISPRRQRRSRSPRHGMNTKVRKEERAPCSRDSEAKDGVHPRTPIAVRKAQGILKITLKVKTMKADTGSLSHEGKSSVSKMMISPNLGCVPRLIRSRLESVTSTSRKHECQNFKKGGGFSSQHRTEKRPDRFTLLIKTPKEIMALEKGKFKTPPPMTTPVEKQNANKFCQFHREVGHNTDECNHLRKQIEDMLKTGKLSHIIRELKQNSGKEQPKKKGETN
ncbi:hypothetical protein Tco_1432090, partial [Tanacetum coccineum]